MHRYPPPNLHDLLLPVIACLPTAFFSPQAPPALLTLLSPILRQRVSLHSQTVSAPGTRPNTWENNWLNLLTWSPQRAEQLREICSELQLEPHPVSGELELFEDGVETIEYRHLDAETVQAKCDVAKYGISVVWTWCTNDSGAVGVEGLTGASGGEQNTKDGWRIAEVRPIAMTEDETWYSTQAEAEEAPSLTSAAFPPTTSTTTTAPAQPPRSQPQTPAASEDDYWASYDRTPSTHTPAHRSPAPPSTALNPLTSLHRHDSETEYFARYASEVQPALDAHDPDEAAGADGDDFDSTLGPSQSAFDRRSRQLHGQPTPPYEGDTGIRTGTGSKENGATSNSNGAEEESYPMPCTEIPSQSTIPPVSAPRVPQPSESNGALSTLHNYHQQPVPHVQNKGEQVQVPQSSRSDSPIHRLEQEASATSAAEVGVKQHISTEMKSLYRLARAVGIEREEFERIVGREIEVLGMLD